MDVLTLQYISYAISIGLALLTVFGYIRAKSIKEVIDNVGTFLDELKELQQTTAEAYADEKITPEETLEIMNKINDIFGEKIVSLINALNAVKGKLKVI